ncbi:mevalonate kinase [Kitasatospora sp. NPDC057692]|uniref:mevalonate kinase n=1 Tax=Kitasatospora sp. NPDC057692 TaxID=3346215 RepID=UPI0036B0DABF
MIPSSSTRGAPGKVILFGEHSVAYRQPAIATPIDRTLTLTVTLGGNRPTGPAVDPSLRAAIDTAAQFFSLAPDRITTSIESRIPAGYGLGSSAALSVALARTLADLSGTELGRVDLLAQATAIESAFHGASSGLDVAAVALGTTTWFHRVPSPHATLLPIGTAFDLVVAVTRHQRSTAEQIQRVRRRAQSRPDALSREFARLGALTRAGRHALFTGDLCALGRFMDEAHTLLAGIGVSTPALELAVTTARTAGALGAKLTGAGGGGAIIALAPGNAPAVAAALRAAGCEPFISRVAAARPSGAKQGAGQADRVYSVHLEE